MKIAVITGASSGMGNEFVKQIDALQLDEIWVVARRRDRLEQLVSTCKTKIVPMALDLSRAESIAQLKSTLAACKPDVRILVNASGFGKYGTYLDLTDEEIDSMIDVNVRALIKVTYAVLPYMNKGARVINLGSASAFQPLPYFIMYASTKSFVVHFSRALNVELRERGITVTSVCPGYVRTEFMQVAQQTKNPDTCTNFTPMYESADVVRKALRDSEKGKDLSVLGFTTKLRRVCAKLLPTKMVMNTWLKMR